MNATPLMKDIILKYIDGSIGEEELARLEGWLDEAPGNRREFIDMCRIWNLSEFDRHRQNLNVEEELGVFHRNIGRKGRGFRPRRLYIVISSVAACLILAVLAVNINRFGALLRGSSADIMAYVNGGGDAGFNELSVPYGEHSSLALPGTTVRASAGTRLVYPKKFGKKGREIFVDGRIYIEVTKDARRPFTVRTRGMDITVLGTKFIVTAYGDRPVDDVVLVEGSVSVSNRDTGNTTILTPDRIYIYDETTGSEETKEADTAAGPSWTDGKYKFDREPLVSVLTHLSACNVIKNDADGAQIAGLLNYTGGEGRGLQWAGLANVVPIAYTFEDGTYRIELLK